VSVETYSQRGDIRFEWGPVGAAELAKSSDVIIVVDIFSFTTATDVATSRGAAIYPYPTQGPSARRFAQEIGGLLAVDRRDLSAERPYSLWPRSLESIPAGTKLVLPSLNGSAISSAAVNSQRQVLAGCLRNRSAVALMALKLGRTIGVIAAGERGRREACVQLMKISSVQAQLLAASPPKFEVCHRRLALPGSHMRMQ
jgi:2-phosphosulfolactate phosphatase